MRKAAASGSPSSRGEFDALSRLGEAKATALTDALQAPPIMGQDSCLGDSMALTHPDCQGHVIHTHLGKVTLQHPVVKTVEEEGDAEVHCIFWFDVVSVPGVQA